MKLVSDEAYGNSFLSSDSRAFLSPPYILGNFQAGRLGLVTFPPSLLEEANRSIETLSTSFLNGLLPVLYLMSSYELGSALAPSYLISTLAMSASFSTFFFVLLPSLT